MSDIFKHINNLFQVDVAACDECEGRGTRSVECIACSVDGRTHHGGSCRLCNGTGEYLADCTECGGAGYKEVNHG